MTKNEFIEQVAALVCKYAPDYNIYCPSAVIAQAILESAWGESTLAAKYHNYFGMKCGTLWQGKSVNLETQEEYTPGELTTIKDNFRVYDSMEEGIKGYFEFIQLPRYQNLKGIYYYKTYLQTIKADGYATSSTYVENVSRVVEQYELTKYDPRRMTPIEIATQWMEALATDDTHGYDQIYRWGEKGDYDCSSAIITAWKTAGVPLTCTYTGNMKADMISKGFMDVTSSVNLSTGAGLIRGDVLLNEAHHVAMYIGDGKEVEASINERGGATGGTPGDQTSREILIRTYRNYPWNCILRFAPEVLEREPVKTKKATIAVPYITVGSKGPYVATIQFALNLMENAKLDVDGEFGPATDKAIRAYQAKKSVEVSGICGIGTLRRLLTDEAAKTYQ